jgi:pseudouridine synthase
MERLQKVMAKAGIASRRKAELLILEGAVSVNGRVVTELGTKVDPAKDKIKVNGKLILADVEPIYLALYKPKGVISAMSDPEGRRHLGILLKSVRERVNPIGRLDFNSEGLLLLTNDGKLAEKIFKARELPKTYMLKIKGHPAKEDLDFLKKGVFTAEGVARFAAVDIDLALRNKSWLKVDVIEGAKLDLRELFNRRGLMVDRIVRSAIGHITLRGLEPGEFRFLKRSDFERLLEKR